METCEYEGENINSRELTPRSNTPRSEGRNSTDSYEQKRRNKEGFYIKVRQFVLHNITIPTNNCFNLKECRFDVINQVCNLDNYIIKNAIRDTEQDYIDYTISDFYNMYSKGDYNVLFKCNNYVEYNRKYLSLKCIMLSLLALIYFQCDYDLNAVDTFFMIVAKMCDLGNCKNFMQIA